MGNGTMTWAELPGDLARLADPLDKEPATARTAHFLRTYQGLFRHNWKTGKFLKSSEGAPIPPPRQQALHPTGCKVDDAYLHFEFQLEDSAEEGRYVLPIKADFQVRVVGHLEFSHCSVELEDHWRVDTDIYADGQASGEPRLALSGGLMGNLSTLRCSVRSSLRRCRTVRLRS